MAEAAVGLGQPVQLSYFDQEQVSGGRATSIFGAENGPFVYLVGRKRNHRDHSDKDSESGSKRVTFEQLGACGDRLESTLKLTDKQRDGISALPERWSNA
jgi:hypothetical protein